MSVTVTEASGYQPAPSNVIVGPWARPLLADTPGAIVHAELTADGARIILLADGDDYQIATAAKRCGTLTPLIKPTQPPGGLQLPVSWSAVIQLSHEFGGAWRPGPALTAWITDQVSRRTEEYGALTVAPPAGLEPRPYQVSGARMIGLVGSGLLWDDPGTGKTVTTILGLVERHADRVAAGADPITPVIVICPSSVVDDWVDHVHRWAPGWRAVAWRGSPGARRKLAGSAHVYVVSYGVARRDAATADPRKNPLVALGARYLVVDEVHKIKAQSTDQSKAARRLAERCPEGFIGLSGTPITHNVGDIWPALACLDPAGHPSRERFVDRYCDSIMGDYSTEEIIGLSPPREPEFRQLTLGSSRRVAKADVLEHLPPKVYSVRKLEMPERYRKVYAGVEADMLATMPEGGDELSPMDVLSQLNGLSMIASAAADVNTWWEQVPDPETGVMVDKRHQNITLKAPSWKADELLEILAERGGPGSGNATVTAAPSAQLVTLAGAQAAAAGYAVGYIVGGQSNKVRREQMRSFQAGELDLMCVSTGAGGVGITLTRADALVFLQRPWSYVDAVQQEDRCHRIGSEVHSSIEIIDLVTINSVESRVRAVLVDKADALSNLVQDPRIVTQILGGAEVRDLRKGEVKVSRR